MRASVPVTDTRIADASTTPGTGQARPEEDRPNREDGRTGLIARLPRGNSLAPVWPLRGRARAAQRVIGE